VNPVVENLRKLMLAEDRWRTVDELARALRKQFGLPCMANDVRECLRELTEIGYMSARRRHASPATEYRLFRRAKEEKK
jgi:hypothetical protein